LNPPNTRIDLEFHQHIARSETVPAFNMGSRGAGKSGRVADRAAYRIERGDEGPMRDPGDDIGGRARGDYGLYGVTVTVTDWTTVAPSVTGAGEHSRCLGQSCNHAQ